MKLLLKDLPKEDLPRERLLSKGVESLSNEELLSILISTGTRDESAKALSEKILSKYKNVKDLSKATLGELTNIKGVGIAKGASILASIELGKRVFMTSNISRKMQIKNAKSAYEVFSYLIENDTQENFLVIYLDNHMHYIEHKILFKGTINKSLVHPREVIKNALLLDSTKIILMHNHPSGVLVPSTSDDEITSSIITSSLTFGLVVLDHIIVGGGSYYSYEENERIKYI